MNREIYLVITSISSPNTVLKDYAGLCRENNVKYIVIGDSRSPGDFYIENCQFYGISQQAAMFEKMSGLLPVGHYSRKNLGYLQAIKNGAGIIIETDDDNLAKDNFFQLFPEKMITGSVENAGWLNIYSYFTHKKIWPRGFPLDLIQQAAFDFSDISTNTVYAPIQQGLVDGDPDVDAIYRLLHHEFPSFEENKTIALGKSSWCPFNSQNTVWYQEAFPLLYLPSFCSSRMTDIWRSLVAQRIAWENNWHILFYSPTVRQERNEHNLLRDFEDEIQGYLHNKSISAALDELVLMPGKQFINENMMRCYTKLVEMNLLDPKELKLLLTWSEGVQKYVQ